MKCLLFWNAFASEQDSQIVVGQNKKPVLYRNKLWVNLQIRIILGVLWWSCWEPVLVIFNLAQVNPLSCIQKNYQAIWICILYPWKYPNKFRNFMDGVVGHMKLVTGIDYCSAKMWLKLGMSSGGQNFTVLSILSSKDMYYELNSTIILDWWSNMHPWKTILGLSSSPLIFLLNLLAWAQWTIRYLEHKGFIANISQNFYS